MSSNHKERIAKLETQLDVMETELCHINELLLRCGFPEGIRSLKKSIEEYLSNSFQPEN